MERLDIYTDIPEGMRNYLSNYGWHFSKKMFEFAVSSMIDKEGNKIEYKHKDVIDNMFKMYGINITYKGYDVPYVFNMCIADFYGSSITNDRQACLFVKDYIEDKDGYDEITFTRFYADTIAKGIPLNWEDLI